MASSWTLDAPTKTGWYWICFSRRKNKGARIVSLWRLARMNPKAGVGRRLCQIGYYDWFPIDELEERKFFVHGWIGPLDEPEVVREK